MKKFIWLFFLISHSLWGFTPSSDATISVLTCSSGKEIYKVYGHSALRFQDPSKGIDIVYNYGMFDFSAPHFIWRYLRGKNNYLLGREHFERFKNRYLEGGEKVVEQTIDLNKDELKTLFEALEYNAKPENREYLYNVFYDNCATRVYRIIEDNLDGGIIWEERAPEVSFRVLLHHCNKFMPFSQMGIDLVFGPKADKKISLKEEMFLPEKLMKNLNHATKTNNTPIIAQEKIILKGRKISNKREIILFNIVFIGLMIFALSIRFKFTKLMRGFRIALYSILGLASLVVCFIAFFSIHPTVLPNYNLLWINPIWLAIAVLLSIKKEFSPKSQRYMNYWSMIMAAYLIIGLSGLFYIHYGFIYIITIIVATTYKRI